ncbi:MAG TPA: hypothetical protein VMD76_00430 [Candidatus Sulfotelmatobacter sp.]|nr:hypothetical protein [Candidatus Sulfotelmatobacter sp.]
MVRHLIIAVTAASLLAITVAGQDSQSGDKSFDVRSSVGDLHMGKDADAGKAGLPLYPGARVHHEENNDPLNFGVLTESFGFKIVVAKYESDDAPAKIIDFYRGKLKRYGKVLECHSQKEGGDVEAKNDDKDSNQGKQLKCEEDSGPVTELKVGTEDDQHVVAVEPADGHKGTTFSVIYVRTQGKRGDI